MRAQSRSQARKGLLLQTRVLAQVLLLACIRMVAAAQPLCPTIGSDTYPVINSTCGNVNIL